MAITTTLINVAKQGFLSGAFLAASVYQLALIKTGATGTYDATFAGQYQPTLIEEVANGGGYTTSGTTLTGITYTTTTGTGSIDWGDASWPASTISAIGACLYKSGTGGVHPIIAFFDFGGTVASTNGTFTVTIPAAGVGVIRLS